MSKTKPPHSPTKNSRAKVSSMAAVGIPQDDIARVVGITGNTLRKHYREELDTAMTTANTAVAGQLYQSAMNGNVQAQIFWCKTRLHWRETNRTELTGADGKDLAQKIEIEFISAKGGD